MFPSLKQNIKQPEETKLSHGPALVLCTILLRLQQETLRHCYWDVICDKPSTVNIGWWLQPRPLSSFHKNIPWLQYCTYGVALLWRSNYSEQSKELKTGHLNELRQKYMRKQENVFITFQASNWKNRDQYSRTSFNGVKNNPPQDRQESLIAKQTGQLGLGRAQRDAGAGAIPPASAARDAGARDEATNGGRSEATQRNIPPKRPTWQQFAAFSPRIFSSMALPIPFNDRRNGVRHWLMQKPRNLGWEMGTQHVLIRAEVQPMPLGLAPSVVRRKRMLLSHGFMLSMMLGTCRRTPLPHLSPLIPFLVESSRPCRAMLTSFLHPSSQWP